MRTLTITVILLVVLIAGAYAFASFLRRTSMFFPERYPIGMWNTRSLPVQPEDVTFRTADGVTLHGWLFRAHDAAFPLLIWYHGNAGNITGRAPMAAEFARRGMRVLLVEWRGYGKSEGSPSENALYGDALAAYDLARSTGLATGQSGPVLYGESLGGPYAAYVASRRKVSCVVIENSFPSLAAVGNAIYFPLGYLAPGAMTTTRWLNQAGVPVLVMHGRRDEVIPFRLGMQLYEGLRVPKEMLVSDNATHCAIPEVEGERYFSTVLRFARAHSR